MTDGTKDLARLLHKDNLSEWGNSDFWKKLCPSLSIAESSRPSPAAYQARKEDAEQRRKLLVENGFALADNEDMDEELITNLRNGIETLRQHHLPATFILLFDETWDMARKAKTVLAQSTHSKNTFNFDILAWYIEAGGSGFSPHRDRQPEDAAATFHPDQQAKFVTMWIALSDATPANSCLYVIPKTNDPGYVEGDSDDQDPLQKALPDKNAFQYIRAIPRRQGQSLLFTHRIIHWGSKNTTTVPRIAISFVCSDPTYEASYVDPKYSSDPPFRIRLLLACAQLLIYHERFDLPIETIRACYDFCKQNENDLEDAYRKKVFYEFVQAMKEEGPDKQVGNGEEDNEEAVMEEMLNSEEAGCGEFQDDYDELVGTEPGVGEDDAMENLSDQEEFKNAVPFGEEEKKKKKANEKDEDGNIDAVQEEMLDAEENGYGEFQDDYDEIVGAEPEAAGDDTYESLSDKEEFKDAKPFDKRKADTQGENGESKRRKTD